MLQRRREYVTLRAQGMPAAELRLLVLGEAGIVATGGAVAGAAVGLAMAPLFVHVLRPLFVLDPRVTPPAATVVAIAGVPIAAAVVGSLIAAAMLERIEPTELLRES